MSSGSVDFSLNRNDVIQEAMELIGVYDVGMGMSNEDISSCARSLNMMVKSWQAKDIKIWKISEGSLTLVASQSAYVLGPGGDLVIDKPLRIIEARIQDSSSIDIPLTKLSRTDYKLLSNKTTTGIPTQYYYQPGKTTGTLNIWPVPDATTAANYTGKVSYYSPLEDFDVSSDTPDFPSEWFGAIAYNLAVWIAPKFKVPLSSIPDVVGMAQDLLYIIETWDQEDVSVYFGVDNE